LSSSSRLSKWTSPRTGSYCFSLYRSAIPDTSTFTPCARATPAPKAERQQRRATRASSAQGGEVRALRIVAVASRGVLVRRSSRDGSRDAPGTASPRRGAGRMRRGRGGRCWDGVSRCVGRSTRVSLSGAACGEPPVAPSGRNSTAGRYSTPVARTRPPIEPVPPLDPPVAEKGGRVVNQGDHPRPAARRVIMALRCCASSPLSVPTTRHAVASTPLRGESSPVPRSTPSRASPGFPPGHCGPVGGDAGGPCGPPSGGGTER